MILKLTNNLTKSTTNYDVMDMYSSEIFFHFNIKLGEDMIDGEYTYELFDGEKKVAEGVLQIGDYKASTTVFNKEKKTYKVYGK